MKTRFTVLLSISICLFISVTSHAQTVPTPDHMVVVVLENHSYSQIIGSADAPYINSLTNDSFGALFTNSHGMTHPSQPNYMYLFSGDNQNVILDLTPISLLLPFTATNLGAGLLQNGRTFTAYSEDLPSVGFTGDNSGKYYRKHAPWVNWQDGTSNGIPAVLNQPFTAFPGSYDSLPTLSFVIPNQDHDMHDGTIAQADTWLQTNLNSYIEWAKAHNSLLIVTFDEDESLTGNNQIATIFIGQMVKQGHYNETVDHNRVLRTMEDMYGLPYAGGSSGSTPIIDCWVYKPVSALSAAPVAICPGQTVSFTNSTTNLPTVTQWVFTGGNPLSSSAQNPSVTYDNAGVYDVTLISSNQMGADTLVQSAYITVYPIPVVSLNADSVRICTGDTAIITANGATLYNWLPSPGLFYSAGNTMKANPVTNTVYQVIGLMNGCISDTASVSVSIDSILVPALSISPVADTTVCNGSVVVLKAMVTNGGNNPFYQWKINGNNTNTHTAVFSTFAFGNNYSVSCVFTSSATCAIPATITGSAINIIIEQAPHPVILAIDSELISTAAASYQWYFNGQSITGATAQTYIAVLDGSYRVEAFSAAGCSAFSDSVTVTLAVTDIQNLVSSSLLTLFPNPNSGEFVLKSSSVLKGDYRIQLFDVLGRQVYQTDFYLKNEQQEIPLSLTHVEHGAYLLSISQAGKALSSKIFIQ